ncbi:MAG: DsrE family protein [Campylobacterales bacterium]|nr:DsrE family protein [Campylobacterales bacterium]
MKNQMIKIFTIAAMLSSTLLFAAEQKVVFDLTSGDEAKIRKHLISNIEGLAEYYEANDVEFKVAVVISGNAYKYFVQDIAASPYREETALIAAQKRLEPLFEKLHAELGVEFDMCKAGMKARKIEKKVLYPYVKNEMNKSAYLIKWQNRGYAYLPVH